MNLTQHEAAMVSDCVFIVAIAAVWIFAIVQHYRNKRPQS